MEARERRNRGSDPRQFCWASGRDNRSSASLQHRSLGWLDGRLRRTAVRIGLHRCRRLPGSTRAGNAMGRAHLLRQVAWPIASPCSSRALALDSAAGFIQFGHLGSSSVGFAGTPCGVTRWRMDRRRLLRTGLCSQRPDAERARAASVVASGQLHACRQPDRGIEVKSGGDTEKAFIAYRFRSRQHATTEARCQPFRSAASAPH